MFTAIYLFLSIFQNSSCELYTGKIFDGSSLVPRRRSSSLRVANIGKARMKTPRLNRSPEGRLTRHQCRLLCREAIVSLTCFNLFWETAFFDWRKRWDEKERISIGDPDREGTMRACLSNMANCQSCMYYPAIPKVLLRRYLVSFTTSFISHSIPCSKPRTTQNISVAQSKNQVCTEYRVDRSQSVVRDIRRTILAAVACSCVTRTDRGHPSPIKV